METDNFFEKQSPESRAKTDIVTSFFPAWLKIIGAKSQGPLGYMELFAGPGKFRDGTPSTPILVLEHILSTPYAPRFHVVLNEMDAEVADQLKHNVESLPNIGRLREAPILLRTEVNRGNAAEFLCYLNDYPAVLFVDPFGYKGVSQQLFREFMLRGWGRDAILFFNYKRINAALSNSEFSEHMEALFGENRARELYRTLNALQPHEREQRVHAAMEDAMREAGIMFLQRYDFERRGDSLFFMSKKEKGLRVMALQLLVWALLRARVWG